MAVKNILQATTLSSINSAAFTGAYQLLSAATGLPVGCSILRIINNSTKDVTISYDGSTDNDFLPTLNTLQIPAQSNSQPNAFLAIFPKGQKVWVKGAAGTGLVYLAGYYSPNSLV